MPVLSVENALLSRRGVLKVGACASALLATAGLGASLSGCSASSSASVAVRATMVCATGTLKARRMAFDSISDSTLRRSASRASISILAPSASGRPN